jgi:hypothetical protein
VATLLFVIALAQAAPSPAPPPTLAQGIRLVNEGDFETAVTALRAVTVALASEPSRSAERARASLYLGVAQLALDRPADAHQSFLAALRDDKSLRVTEEHFSPKVVSAFEAARAERGGASAKGGGSGGRVAAAALAGAAVAAGAVVVLGGSGEEPVVLENLRFAQPSINCPDGSNQLPIAYALLVDVVNEGDDTAVRSVELTARIEVSEVAEVGFTSNRPATASPASLTGGRRTTVRVESTLLCSNTAGGPPRFNEWSARLILTTEAGAAAAQTSPAANMRVVIP